MLQQNGGGDGIDVSLAAAGGPAHLPDGPQRGGRCESLIHETRRKTGSFLELGRDVAHLDRSWRVLTVAIKGQANDEALHAELGTSADHLGDGWSLAAPPLDEAGRRRDGPRGVADGEADAPVTVIDRE
jgi:hypothetical protein